MKQQYALYVFLYAYSFATSFCVDRKLHKYINRVTKNTTTKEFDYQNMPGEYFYSL